MLLAAIFILGTINFAVNKAVLESNHPMLSALPAPLRRGGGRLSLVFEFLVLLAAMLLAANGWWAALFGYGLYSSLNGFMAWLILTHRI